MGNNSFVREAAEERGSRCRQQKKECQPKKAEDSASRRDFDAWGNWAALLLGKGSPAKEVLKFLVKATIRGAGRFLKKVGRLFALIEGMERRKEASRIFPFAMEKERNQTR